MKIDQIEDNIERISNLNYRSIVELIIDAIRTFPKYIDDTGDFFEEIKNLLQTDNITLDALKSFADEKKSWENEKDIWTTTSLTSLLEAFKLMQFYRISFSDLLKKIEFLKI